MRGKLVLAVAGALLFAVAGCSSPTTNGSPPPSASSTSHANGRGTTPVSQPPGPAGSAVDAFKQWVREYADGQYDRMWDTLAVEEQRFVAKAKFMNCRAQTINDDGINSISYDKTITTYSSDVDIPGTSKIVHSTAITAQLTLNGTQTQNVTAHWFVEGGAWRWSQDQASVDAYRSGSCPAN